MNDQGVSFRFIRHVIKNFSHFICERNFTLGFSAKILDLKYFITKVYGCVFFVFTETNEEIAASV